MQGSIGLVAAHVVLWSLGCGAGAAGPGTGGAGGPDPRLAPDDLASLEITHVSQLEPSSTTYAVRSDGTFEILETGQDYGYVGHTVSVTALPTDLVRTVFEAVAEAAADVALVDPAQARRESWSTSLASTEVVLGLADGRRLVAATEPEAEVLQRAVEPVEGALFERTRQPDAGGEPTPEGWTQLGVEIPGTEGGELARAVPRLAAVLASDGRWLCVRFVGASPTDDGRTVYETRMAAGALDATGARELLRLVLEAAQPSSGGWSTERSDSSVHLHRLDEGWGAPTAEAEPRVLEAWQAHAARLDPVCGLPE